MLKVFTPEITFDKMVEIAQSDPDHECVIISPDGDFTSDPRSYHVATMCIKDDKYYINGRPAHPEVIKDVLVRMNYAWDDFETWFVKTCPKALIMKNMMRISYFAGLKRNSFAAMA